MAGLLSILVIEDDEDTRANLVDILELDDYKVELAATAIEVRQRTDWQSIDAIILDWKLPDGTAEELLPFLREQSPDVAVIISTGAVGFEGAVTALRHGAFDYILKPIQPDALRASLARIAERNRLVQEKARSESAFRSLVETAPCMILILRSDATLLYFSPFAEELTGYRIDEVLGQNYCSFFITDDAVADGIYADIEKVLKGQPTRGMENGICCKDGSERWLLWNAERIDHHGESAVLAIGQDITSLKQAEQERMQAARLAAIGQMITGIAHESGNALARAQAALELLELEVEQQPVAVDLVARIQKANDALQRLYEEVRNYAAPLHIERQDWDLRRIWQQAWNHLSNLWQSKNVNLLQPDEMVRCRVDPFRMDQVFRNILENALAVAPEESVLEIRAHSVTFQEKPAIQVLLRDHGPGLTSAQEQQIFDPFFTTKTKGTGLGMAITRRIIEAHGGIITARNASEGGAEIILTIPLGV